MTLINNKKHSALKLHVKTLSNWIRESFEYHRDLCPTFWSNSKFDPQIRAKLLNIANDFWNSLDLTAKIVDIQLTGSLANYNWTQASDLDLHIIIDFSDLDEDLDLVRKALDGQRFIWNQRHPVELRGHEVECYIQHIDEQHNSSGLYSMLEDEWVVKPSWNPPTIDQKDVTEKARVLKSEFFEIKREIQGASGERAKMLYDYLSRFKKKIMKDRKESITRQGEYSIENLVFKELRRSGIIEDIIDTASTAYSNTYNESAIYPIYELGETTEIYPYTKTHVEIMPAVGYGLYEYGFEAGDDMYYVTLEFAVEDDYELTPPNTIEWMFRTDKVGIKSKQDPLSSKTFKVMSTNMAIIKDFIINNNEGLNVEHIVYSIGGEKHADKALQARRIEKKDKLYRLFFRSKFPGCLIEEVADEMIRVTLNP